MHIPESTSAAGCLLRPFAIPVVGFVALIMIARSVELPSFVFDDVSVILIVAVAVRWGLGPAIVVAILSVSTAYVVLVPTSTQLPRTVAEDVANLAMLVGIAIIVNRLVTRARQAKDVAERGAARERQVRQERERFVATVAHDLATPLTAASGTLQFAKQFGLTQNNDDRHLLRRLETATARATSLVRTLTDVDDRGVADLREIVRPIAEMMDRVSGRHPISLTLAEKPALIDADVERLQRVFENVLYNAIKYSPEGGPVEVSVRRVLDQATVVVRDHGMGIATDVGSRIFDLSYRAPQASELTPGHGLGLHIAAHIVAEHGGSIEAEPAAGGGTAILVRLPLVTGTTWPQSGGRVVGGSELHR